MSPKPSGSSITIWLLLLYCLTIALHSTGQPVNGIQQTRTDITSIGGFQKNARPAMLSQTSFPNIQARVMENSSATCKTSTFYMHLPAPAGEKISLQKLQTMPDGNFIIAGSLSSGNQQEGLIIKMNNAGVMLAQQRVRINGKPSAISGIEVMLTGELVIAGTIQDGTNAVFVAKLKPDLSTLWTQVSALPSAPLKVTLNLLNADGIALGVQLSSSIVYSTFTITGALRWSYELPVTGLADLVGFSNFNYQSFGILINYIENGKLLVRIAEIKYDDGNIRSSSVIGDGKQEYKFLDATYFNNRLYATGIVKSGTGFQLERSIMYKTGSTEARQIYTTSNLVGSNTTAAIDNAGDAMCFCLPDDGRLILIKHFADYFVKPDFTTQYTVPKGLGITSITRSLQDGGFLFALNTGDNKESILIKTDSIGTLPGCGYANITTMLNEETDVPNTSINDVSKSNTPAFSSVPAVSANVSLTPQFDCDEAYCPAEPTEDSCLSTYLKILRSNSFIDFFTSHYLMRNNNQIVLTMRYDRVLGDGTQTQVGLKLFDEKGHFIKGASLFLNGISDGFDARRMDDRSIMLLGYSTKGNTPQLTFTLVTDDLQIVWTKSVETYNNFEFGGEGSSSVDITKDEQGNYYYVTVTPAAIFSPDKTKMLIYKMNTAGDKVWLKTYELDKVSLSTISAVTTKSSLIAVADGFYQNSSASVKINKETGEMQKAYYYQIHPNPVLFHRSLILDNDRIFYAGSGMKDGQVIMGVLDTTAQPLKFRYLKNALAVPVATARNGMMYLAFHFLDENRSNPGDALVKVDTGLNLQFMNTYDSYGYASRWFNGIATSDNGSIYIGGNFHYNVEYFDAYIAKYNSNGETGTCNYTSQHPEILDIDLKTTTVSFKEVQRILTPVNIPVTFVPDVYGQAISAILCSTTPECNFISIAGPGAVCRLNEDYSFYGKKNATCTLHPVWLYDTAYASLHTSAIDTVQLSFKKTGNTYVVARLNAGCKFYDDSLLVHVQKAPVQFSLGNDTLLCPGDSIQLNAGSGFNSYHWQDGSADSLFTVTKSGNYHVQVDNVCSDVYRDTVVVAMANLPTLKIGNDTTTCKGDTLRLAATAGFVQYSWSPPMQVTSQARQTDVIPLQNTMLTLQAVTVDGCIGRDTLNLTVITAHPVYLGTDTSFCNYDSINLNAGSGYTQYQWSTGSNTSAIIAKQAGEYWVHAKDVNGCYAKDTMVVKTLYSQPDVHLGADKDLCTGDVVQLDAGDYTSYHWQNGSAGRYYTAFEPGTYWVSVVDKNSCAGSDTFTISKLLPLPANFLKAMDSLCEYEKLVLKPAGTFQNYFWSTGERQPAITISKAGNYMLSVRDANGCSGSDTIQIVQKHCMAGVFIPSAFSPNKDWLNDVFRARVYGAAIAFNLQVYNRFGEMVFATTDPQKGWDGNYKGQPQDAGTFVWQCSYHLDGSQPAVEKGTVVLLR